MNRSIKQRKLKKASKMLNEEASIKTKKSIKKRKLDDANKRLTKEARIKRKKVMKPKIG
jgi:hypothetical protein